MKKKGTGWLDKYDDGGGVSKYFKPVPKYVPNPSEAGPVPINDPNIQRQIEAVGIEGRQSKERAKLRLEASKAVHENKPFQGDKNWKKNFRKKGYIEGLALENDGRIFEGTENPIDVVNPLNWIGSAAGRLAQSPLKAETEGTKAYADAIGQTLVEGMLGFDPAGYLGKKVATHPLTNITHDLISTGQYKRLGQVYGLAAANRVAPLVANTPILKNIYKDMAYNVASKSHGKPFMSLGEIYGANKGNINYDGTLQEVAGQAERNLLKQYIYGNQPGFEPIDLPTRGLDAYTKRYGQLPKYKMHSNTPHGETVNMDTYTYNSYMEAPQIESGVHAQPLEMGNPVIPLDDIAGHMTYLNTNKAVPTLTTQDIWKFHPEDYMKRWNSADREGLIDRYIGEKQIKLMERSGKPFVLMQENPVNKYKPNDYASLNELKDIPGPPPEFNPFFPEMNTVQEPMPMAIKEIVDMVKKPIKKAIPPSKLAQKKTNWLDKYNK